jgi:formamidopyrimidine-DNA glycosylase
LAEVRILDPGAIRPKFSTRPSHAMDGGAQALLQLVGHPAAEPHRHGKRIGWSFGPRAIGIHLGMTGVFVVGDPPRFTKVGLRFDDDWIWFKDMRRFGCLVPWPTDDLAGLLTAGHGPDALLEPLDGAALAERMHTKKAIKVALLDQDRLTGVGNIHAIEALFTVRIDPKTPAQALTSSQWAALADAIPSQLQRAITAQDGPDFVYITDGGPNVFQIYGREGKECPRCNAIIERFPQSGRSTFRCPTCQCA